MLEQGFEFGIKYSLVSLIYQKDEEEREDEEPSSD